MANMIPVAGLGGAVWVQVTATFGAGSDVMAITLPDKQYSVSAQLKEIKQQSRLEIKVRMDFPPYYDGVFHSPYTQIATGSFDNIAGVDGSLKFSNIETDLQTNDTDVPPGHKFHYLGGKAVLAPSNNPSVYVIKIVLTVGSADVIVTMNTTSTAETTSTTDSTSKTTTTTKGGGKIYDVLIRS